jgi:hypothetical protein
MADLQSASEPLKTSGLGENMYQNMYHLPSSQVRECPILEDPDLARVLSAWPNLPTAIKAGILAMVDASRGEPNAGTG